MDFLFIVGRVLFSLIFLVSGFGHLTMTDQMVGYAQFKKVPAPKPAVRISGLLLVLAALSITFGVYADLGALVVAVLMVIIAVKMHNFWTETDAQQKLVERTSFLKDLGLGGAALILFVVIGTAKGFDVIGPMLTDALFNMSR